MIERAAAARRPGPYQIEAAIAACHVEAASYAATDWAQIVVLYDLLLHLAPSPVVRLHRAVALARRSGAGGFDADGFAMAYAIMAAQRNSKILGIFVRLNERDGKPHYLKHLPRIRDYVGRTLAHPSLSRLRAFYESMGIVGASS